MTRLVAGRDNHSTPTWVLDFTTAAENYSTTLAADTEQTLAVPAGKTIAVFTYTPGANVFVAQSDSAITLPGASFATSEGELNPVARNVTAGETLRFRSDSTPYVNVTFYEV